MLKIAVVAVAMVFAAGGIGLLATSYAMHPTPAGAAVSPYDLQLQANHRNLPSQEIQDFSVVFR